MRVFPKNYPIGDVNATNFFLKNFSKIWQKSLDIPKLPKSLKVYRVA